MFHYPFFMTAEILKSEVAASGIWRICYMSWAEVFILEEYKSDALLNDHSVDKFCFSQNSLNTTDLHRFKVKNSDRLNCLWFWCHESILSEAGGCKQSSSSFSLSVSSWLNLDVLVNLISLRGCSLPLWRCNEEWCWVWRDPFVSPPPLAMGDFPHGTLLPCALCSSHQLHGGRSSALAGEVGSQPWRWGCWGSRVPPPFLAKVDEMSWWALRGRAGKGEERQAEERVQVQEHHARQGTRSVTRILLRHNHAINFLLWISCRILSCRTAIALTQHTAFLPRTTIRLHFQVARYFAENNPPESSMWKSLSKVEMFWQLHLLAVQFYNVCPLPFPGSNL